MRTITRALTVLLVAAAAAALPPAAADEPAVAVVYVAAHQDDELMSMGSSIVSHVESGYEVIVVPATDGSASRVRHDLTERLGREVTREEFTTYRDAEMRWTVQTGLGATFVIPPAGVRQVDGQMDARGARAVLEWVVATWPSARVKTHSPWDTHPDHVALGVAATRMHEQGVIDDLRLYVPGYIWAQDPAAMWPDLPEVGTVRRWEAVDAQAAYRLWAPPDGDPDRADRYLQIGYTSTTRSFERHADDPASRRHAPAGIPEHVSTP